jgi:hypothetical protein
VNLSRRTAAIGIGGLLATALLTAARSVQAASAPDEVASAIAGSRLLGQGRLTFLGLHVYDARLWAGEGFDPAGFAERPLALELVYARRLVGQQIAERSLKEMKREAGITPEQSSAWLAEMVQAFPDVNKGDRLTGVLLPGTGARFYLNGQRRREVRDTEFARRFFGIWLSDATSQPTLRKALLGRGS